MLTPDIGCGPNKIAGAISPDHHPVSRVNLPARLIQWLSGGERFERSLTQLFPNREIIADFHKEAI